MSQSLELAFNPALIADPEVEGQRRDRLSRAVPPPAARLPYGPGPRQAIDLYRPATGGRACVLYFHGGYWCAGSAAASAFAAGPLLSAGVAVAVVGYELCPAVTLATIVAQARAARDFILARAAELEIDPARIMLCGSSAGAHLSAMLLQDGPAAWPAPPAAALVTGVYDLDPVRQISINATLGLTASDVASLSPLRRTAVLHCRRLLVAVGALEPAPWQAMSADLAAKARAAGVPTEYFVCPGENHFSVTTALGVREHDLACKAVALAAAS